MRLIDAEALVERLGKSHAYHARTTREEVLLYRDIRIIGEQPTIEAKPVVHARWVDVNPNLHIGMKCSLCGARIKYSEFFNGNHRYCHKCGAQMDEGVKIPVISMEDVPKLMEEKE